MKCGLIGEKLGHSYSCEIHSAIADYEYDLIELPPSALDDFFKKRNFDGLNVTIPYKEKVIEYLDEISDEGRAIGAVNTIVNDGGKLVGYNTDYFGIKALFKKAGINPTGKKVLILGTGGTAKTVAKVLSDVGAREIIKVSRTGKDGGITYEDAVKYHKDTNIIFNATPSGMFPHDEGTPIDVDKFDTLDGVLDAVYHPLETNFVLKAKKKGIKAIGGLYMLSAQAVYASALFSRKRVEEIEPLIEKAYESVLVGKRNIVLIGMPASGKSTVGKIIAERTGREFVDIDEVIVKKIGMPIAEFFERYGESEFRKIEKEVTLNEAKRSGIVVATGGGCPLDADNENALKRNGIFVYLDRKLENLVSTSTRPLSSDREKLAKLYEERYSKYLAIADVVINSNVSLEEVAKNVIEECAL